MEFETLLFFVFLFLFHHVQRQKSHFLLLEMESGAMGFICHFRSERLLSFCSRSLVLFNVTDQCNFYFSQVAGKYSNIQTFRLINLVGRPSFQNSYLCIKEFDVFRCVFFVLWQETSSSPRFPPTGLKWPQNLPAGPSLSFASPALPPLQSHFLLFFIRPR